MEQNKLFKMKFLQQGEAGAVHPSLYIYGDIYQTFEDWVSGEPGNTAEGVRRFLEANKDADQIDVYINSMGGDVVEGTAMANQLRRFGGRIVVTVDGFAASVASVIAMAGDVVRMPRNAMMMVHNMWTYMAGNANELRKMADDLDVMMEANKTIYLDKAGSKLDYETLTEMMDNETWLSAEQCLAYGLADEVLNYGVDEDVMMQQAQGEVVLQRAGETIAKLQAAAVVLQEMVEIVEEDDEQLELDEPVKPQNFLEIFS